VPSVLDHVLPPGVVGVETIGDLSATTPFPGEHELVAGAVPKRRAEFTTVRALARQALGQLGLPPTPILKGPGGAPTWPAGVVGSMTHCENYRASAVARTHVVAAIGIDAEPYAPLPAGVAKLILRPAEQRAVDALAAGGWHADRLIFSIKEAIYKACFPLTSRWLDFDDVETTLDLDAGHLPDGEAGSFVGRLLLLPPVAHEATHELIHGRWVIRDGLIVTAASVPPGFAPMCVPLARSHWSRP